MALAEHAPGGTLDREPWEALARPSQLFLSPVRSSASTALGAVLHPRWERRRQRLGKPSWVAWGPVALSTRPALGLRVLVPEVSSRTRSPESLSNAWALAPSPRPQNRLRPGAAAVSGHLQELFEVRLFHSPQPDLPHRFPLSCKPVRESTSKKMQSHPLHE